MSTRERKMSAKAVAKRKFGIKMLVILLLIVSAAVAAVGIGRRLYAIYGPKPVRVIIGQSAESEEKKAEKAMAAANDEMVSLYSKTVLPDTKVTLEEGVTMNFGKDGDFSGFFDKDSTDTTGTYTVTSPEEEDKKNGVLADVTVYNSDQSRIVKYALKCDDDAKFYLIYPGSDVKMFLEY